MRPSWYPLAQNFTLFRVDRTIACGFCRFVVRLCRDGPVSHVLVSGSEVELSKMLMLDVLSTPTVCHTYTCMKSTHIGAYNDTKNTAVE